jgi:hypothetical protein
VSTYDTPIPGADIYAQAELAAKTGYQNAVARLNQQRGDTLQQFGYLGDVDPTNGTVGNLRVDPNNPYGTYQQLLRGSAQAGQAAHDNAAGRGIGGGLAAQGETEAKYGFGQGSFQLGTGLQNSLHGYDSAQTQAQTDEQNQIMGSKLSALQAALQAQLIASQNAAKASGSVSSDDSGDPGSYDPYGSSQGLAPGTTVNVGTATPPTYGITYGPAAGKRASSNKKQGVYTIH